MGRPLPEISTAEFLERLSAAAAGFLEGSPVDLPALGGRLHCHYLELRRWNRRLSLVGPGTAGEIVARHYAESLAALSLLGGATKLVDVGSGAGFPGLVLAAARTDLAVDLVEARERKWLFLKTAARRCGLSCRCLNDRVGPSLPPELTGKIDVVTCRAVALTEDFFKLFQARSPRVRFLLWLGKELPVLPRCLEPRREISLPQSHSRRIVELAPEPADPT